MSNRGKYIVIEGQDGTGKSTQVDIIRTKLSDIGISSIDFHEPAGSPMADEIRTLLKNGDLSRDPITNVLLFNAARRDIWTSRALPALEKGEWVVTARNYYSTLAYQGFGEGIGLDYIETVTRLSMDNLYINPDYVCVMALNNECERAARINKRGPLDIPDAFESKDKTFQDRVTQGYIDICTKRGVPIIPADGNVDEVSQLIWDEIRPLLANKITT